LTSIAIGEAEPDTAHHAVGEHEQPELVTVVDH
jgi:hypothetical protein